MSPAGDGGRLPGQWPGKSTPGEGAGQEDEAGPPVDSWDSRPSTFPLTKNRIFCKNGHVL